MFLHTRVKNPTEMYFDSLVRALFWKSNFRLSKTTRESLAKRFVDRVDFSDSKAMHKSVEGYADLILDDYYGRNKDALKTLKRI